MDLGHAAETVDDRGNRSRARCPTRIDTPVTRAHNSGKALRKPTMGPVSCAPARAMKNADCRAGNGAWNDAVMAGMPPSRTFRYGAHN